VTDPLHGIDLVIFDKDGTLIAFDAMWLDWAHDLGERLSAAVGHDVSQPLHQMLGLDAVTGMVTPHGGLAATPMARLRDMTRAVLVAEGASPGQASAAVDLAWHAPDPVALARPLAPLRPLLEGLRAAGKRVAIATSDDRDPTERTLRALGVDGLVDATVCADDGVAVKPAPDMVLRLCAQLDVDPGRAAVVGDSPADMRMGRAAGAGLVVGVLTGVGDASDLEPVADLVVGSIERLRVG
jgi:phosphoglycolate phosphatase